MMGQNYWENTFECYLSGVDAGVCRTQVTVPVGYRAAVTTPPQEELFPRGVKW